MLTRSVVLATTLTVGLVAGVGSSALAIAFVPGDSSGPTQLVQAIASSTQDPADGSHSSFLDGAPVTVALPKPIVVDNEGEPAAKTESGGAVDPATGPSPTASPSSGPSAEDTATEDKKDQKAAEDKAKKDEKAAEKQAKRDQKAAEEQAKKDQKAAEEQAKQEKKDETEEVPSNY